MWSRLTGSSSSASLKDKDDDARRRRTSDSTRSKRDRDSDSRSVVSSTSTRKPSRRDTAPSSIASFATAFDDMPRSRATEDLYEDPRDERAARRRDDRPSSYASSAAPTTRRDRSRSRDRVDKDKKKSGKDKDKKTDKRKSTRSERSGSASQAGGYRGDIVESPKPVSRSFSGQIASENFSPFPGQVGAPMMSGALPMGSRPHSAAMSSHVQDQFPGQDPANYTTSALPGGNPFGAAADFYNDQGQSVQHQPGVRPQAPAVIVGQDTPHLVSALAQANPVADTGSGAAADFYGNGSSSLSKPPRPSSSAMPGAFIDDGPPPQKPARPSKPEKPSKFGSAATVAGGAALGYAMGHSSSNSQQHSSSYNSSNVHQSASYTNGGANSSANIYYQGNNPSTSATDGSSHLPLYSGVVDGAPPPKPPRPGKPEKQSSGSNAGLYAAGAAGLAAYGVHHHNSHSNSHQGSHNYTSSTTGAVPGQYHNGLGPSPSPFMGGGMTQKHQHTGPVSKFVDWWKDYEDVQKMEEYTEYIGVCKGCFDPRSSVHDAPRKHHYHKRRSNEYIRPSGGIEKQSRYSLKEKKSHSSFSSGDERRKRNSTSAAGWVAAGLGGIGLAKAGKAVFSAGRDDFDDTYSIKSGRDSRSRISRQSRSRSRDRVDYNYGHGYVRRRSRSNDRMSHMSVGVTKDKKDYKVRRRRSRSGSRSSSSSRDGKSSFLGTAIGAGLAGAALGAASKNKHRNRSRSKSPKKVVVQHHRKNSSDDDRRRRRSQQLRRKSSRSSVSGASVIEIGQNAQSQGGFLGGFFAAPPPKEKQYKIASHKKKKKGFFNFGNASASSSDSEMAFGTGYVKRRTRASPKRRNSDEHLKATLAGLGATAAAIAAAKAARSGNKRHNEVVAVKEHRHSRKSSDHPRPGSRYGDDEWEDLPDDGTSESSDNAGLVYGDYDWKKGKSQESLVSNGSGTNKWGWRWGFGKKKRRSSDNLYNNIASTPLIGPTMAGATGALAGAAIGTGLHRHDSESSSVQTLQTVYPVAPNDPTASFDARRTSSVPTPQPLITSGLGAISLQQPQPVHQVPGAMYSTQAPSHSGLVAPVGPPVFSQMPFQPPYGTQYQAQNITIQAPQNSGHPPLPRRANSSPIQTSSWKRDAAIAGLAATAGAAAISAAKGSDRPSSDISNVRFNLTQEQTAKEERERRWERERREEEDGRRREQQRREDDEHSRDEQQKRDEDARKAEEAHRQDQLRREELIRQDEEERRRRELQRQQDEARRYLEAERLAKLEAERLALQRQHQQEEMRAREAREAEELESRLRQARADAQRTKVLEAEAEQMRRDRRETAERREREQAEAARRDAEIREDTERQRREREAQDYTNRYEIEREQRKLEQQPTGSSVSSVATDVRRKERELQARERDLVQPDDWKSTAAGAVAAGAAAAITSAAISSYRDKGKEKKDRRDEKWRDSSSMKTLESSKSNTVEPIKTKTTEPSNVKTVAPSNAKTVEPKYTKTVEPTNVVTFEPSRIEQDYFDDEIFDPNMFKKKETVHDMYQDLEDRYNAAPVTQADFFAPKELLENNNLPKVRPVDPNEGAAGIHVYEAHDDFDTAQSIAPPYPPSYAFTATKDGRPSPQQTWPVPSLNLILPTPPGSRAPSVRSASMPPSPAIEPTQEVKVEPKQDEANRARSRVSWGENQFHHFEVPTPDSYREQFVSDLDLKQQEPKYSLDEVTVEHDSPKSGRKVATYEPDRSQASTKIVEPKETAPSTQYVRDQDDSSWNSIVGAASKKSSKKEKKKVKAAAAVATTGAAVTTAALLSRDSEDEHDFKRGSFSVISNPFSDTHAAPSTVAASTVGSTASSATTAFYSPHDQQSSVANQQQVTDKMSPNPEIVEKAISMHVPGSFDEVSETEKPLENDREASSTSERRGKKSTKMTNESVVKSDARQPTTTEVVRAPLPEPIKEVAYEPEVKTSKKDKKKKSKAAKRVSADSWEESDASPLSSPTTEGDIRDIEPRRSARESSSAEETYRSSNGDHKSSNTSTAAMAGGFAALVGAAMTQDQARMSSDLDRARQNLESAESHIARDAPTSPPNGTYASEENRKYVASTSTTSQDIDDFPDAKTPTRKKDKRHSSGIWSPTIGSPLRTETKYEDYMGSHARSDNINERSLVEAPKALTESPLITAPQSSISRNVYDSGYYAPDDFPLREPGERDSDEFFSAGSDEKEKLRSQAPTVDTYEDYASKLRSKQDTDDTGSRNKQLADDIEAYNRYEASNSRSKHDNDIIRSPGKYDDEDTRSAVSSSSKYDDPDREERRRRRREAKSESREQSRDRGYDFDGDGERKRRHRRHDTDERSDDWDTKSTISEGRSEANGERRRKHKRREGERDGSTESKTRSRSSAASEPGDLYDDRKSSKRRSKRDVDDDNASVISSSSRHDEDRSSKKEREKEKEKRSSGLFGLFSKSKENLAETSSKPIKPKDDDEEERKHRRRKHRSDRGSTYGSDDDDARSTISSSSRREKRSSRSERGEGERRESYDDKVHRSSYAR